MAYLGSIAQARQIKAPFTALLKEKGGNGKACPENGVSSTDRNGVRTRFTLEYSIARV